ncbi:hypothetical protein D3C71_1121580 [compost metagenome]
MQDWESVSVCHCLDAVDDLVGRITVRIGDSLVEYPLALTRNIIEALRIVGLTIYVCIVESDLYATWFHVTIIVVVGVFDIPYNVLDKARTCRTPVLYEYRLWCVRGQIQVCTSCFKLHTRSMIQYAFEIRDNFCTVVGVPNTYDVTDEVTLLRDPVLGTDNMWARIRAQNVYVVSSNLARIWVDTAVFVDEEELHVFNRFKHIAETTSRNTPVQWAILALDKPGRVTYGFTGFKIICTG